MDGVYQSQESYDIIVNCTDMCVQTILGNRPPCRFFPTPSKVLHKRLGGIVRRPTLPTDQTINPPRPRRVTQAHLQQAKHPMYFSRAEKKVYQLEKKQRKI